MNPKHVQNGNLKSNSKEDINAYIDMFEKGDIIFEESINDYKAKSNK